MIYPPLLFNCFVVIQEEDEVPDDETINQMLARSEDEFEVYQVGTEADHNWESLLYSKNISITTIIHNFK